MLRGSLSISFTRYTCLGAKAAGSHSSPSLRKQVNRINPFPPQFDKTDTLEKTRFMGDVTLLTAELRGPRLVLDAS